VGPDEPRYAQVAREMFERGDWITPTLGGSNWFEKPALLYWLEIASYNLFGVNEFAARFGSALFGLGTIASLWVLGRSVTDRSSVTFGDWLALIAATSIGLIVFSRGASFDIILTFPMTAAMVAFYIYASREQKGRNAALMPLVAFYFFVGISLLAKGLVGIVFPYAIVTLYYVLTWRLPSRKVAFSLFWGTLLAAIVASTWYLPMYARHGWVFIDEFFVQHHFQRYTSNKYFHPQPFYFFLWVLPLMTLPWLPFFFGGVWSFLRGLFRSTGNTAEMDPRPVPNSLLIFASCWILVPLAFFSFSGSKLPGYILPALPPALIFAAFSVNRFTSERSNRSRILLSIAGITLLAVVVVIAVALPGFARLDSTKEMIRIADEKGYSDAKVLSMHHVSNNAEFYAQGRLVRDSDGKQKKFLGPAEILNEIRSNDGKPVLVIVPTEYLHQLTSSDQMRTDLIDSNGESSIVSVELK
jgi:4-amino-4-deoxy-L-arabinose transferase-like glycosyltransferase